MISIDIIKFLQKNYTNQYIASSMDISELDIDEILQGKKTLLSNHLINFEKNANYPLYPLLIEAIPEEHLPDNMKKKIKAYKILKNFVKK